MGSTENVFLSIACASDVPKVALWQCQCWCKTPSVLTYCWHLVLLVPPKGLGEKHIRWDTRIAYILTRRMLLKVKACLILCKSTVGGDFEKKMTARWTRAIHFCEMSSEEIFDFQIHLLWTILHAKENTCWRFFFFFFDLIWFDLTIRLDYSQAHIQQNLFSWLEVSGNPTYANQF